MRPVYISGHTRCIGAPHDWDQVLDGTCGVLPVRDKVEVQSGVNFMESLWKPTQWELEQLQNGRPVLLRISGAIHPVVSVSVALASDVVAKEETND